VENATIQSDGEVIAIARHRESRAPIEELNSARITLEGGIEGDCHGQPGPSQITVVDETGWRAAITDLSADLSWTLRRANLLIRGIDLFDTAGQRLKLGEVILEITGENEPCWLMDKQHRGLRKALTPRWRAGISCSVINGGTVKIGDTATLVAANKV
jgi:MOSC domain-containing protein YiiM